MPEVAEVAHACALLRRNVLGLKVRRAVLPLDTLLFPVLKTAENPAKTIENVETQLVGSTIRTVGRHGKYFWLRFETVLGTPLVMLMHFGMTGRIRMRDVHSHMIFMENGGDKKVLKEQNAKGRAKKDSDDGPEQGQSIEGVSVVDSVKKEDSAIGDSLQQSEDDNSNEIDEIWPPKFTKFELFLASTGEPETTVDLAFSDPRRLARVRFLSGDECATDSTLLQVPPLVSLGPDYSKKASESDEPESGAEDFVGDPDPHHHGRPRLPFEDFARLVLTKKKPIKAFLLDQDFFAGIGNWVSDEILYHARIHPNEVISKKVNNPENPVLRRLYDSIIFVMEESVRVEGNAKLFPDDWLMLHRWGKGRKAPKATTKSGHQVDFQTVGGRTSCFVPELQKPLKKEETIKVKEAVKDEKIDEEVSKNARRRGNGTVVKKEIVGVKRRRRNGTQTS